MNLEDATALAARIQETLTEECLAWGAAINAAEEAKGRSTHASLVEIAKHHGVRVAQISSAIAKKLGRK